MLRIIYKFIGNVFWKFFGGVAYSAIWFLFSLAFGITIIGFPLATQCFKIAYLVWKPFGKGVATNYFEHPISNTIWAVTAGALLGFTALVSAILSAMSIIGLPLTKQWLKVAKLFVLPFGAVIK